MENGMTSVCLSVCLPVCPSAGHAAAATWAGTVRRSRVFNMPHATLTVKPSTLIHQTRHIHSPDTLLGTPFQQLVNQPITGQQPSLGFTE